MLLYEVSAIAQPACKLMISFPDFQRGNGASESGIMSSRSSTVGVAGGCGEDVIVGCWVRVITETCTEVTVLTMFIVVVAVVVTEIVGPSPITVHVWAIVCPIPGTCTVKVEVTISAAAVTTTGTNWVTVMVEGKVVIEVVDDACEDG